MNGARALITTLVALALGGRVGAQDAKPAQAPAPAPAGGQEMDPRAKAIKDAYDEQVRRERLLVTINKRNVKIADIVEEFRRQVGWNIVVDYKNIPDDLVIGEFRVENEPARKALEAFAQIAELSIEDVSGTLIMISRPPRLTFNFRDADVKVVIDMIARVSGANIIVSPEVKGSITLSINNVPWNDVLEAVVMTLGFVTVKEKFGILRVIHPDELLKQMDTRVFKLKFIQPPPTYSAKLVQNAFINGIPIQPATDIEELLKRFVLKRVLDTVLSKNATGQVLGKLEFDPQSNVFVVRDTKVVLDRVAQVIAAIDIEPEQVLLDMKFISTQNQDLLTFGTNWTVGDQGGVTLSSSFLRPSTFVAPDGSTLTGKISKLPFGAGHSEGSPDKTFFLTQYDMTMTFRAFKQDRFSRLIQEPTLAVADNTEATIFVGETIAYAEVKTTTNQFGGLEFSLGEASKSPVKIGFQLFVIPRIVVESNKVILTVIPQNDFLNGPSTGAAVPGFTRFSLVSNGQPQTIDLPRISSTTMVTKLIVESGRTAVLGGLVVERASYQDNGIPVLKDLPIISYLFKQREDQVNKDHLLIFITPRIVRSGTGSSDGLKKMLKMREEEEMREIQDKMKKEPEKK
jgi:type IV pilus assembly protein PilQ